MLMHASKLISKFGIALLLILGCSEIAHAQWTQVKNIPSGANPSTCLLLTDGTVLCQANEGGAGWLRLTPDNTGSYENGQWTSFDNAPQGTDSTVVVSTCAPCQWAPIYYASAVLPDGKVAMIGGEYNTNGTGSRATWTPIGFLFDPTKPSGSQWSAQLTQPFGYSTQSNGDFVGCIGDSQSVITQTGTMLIANICGSQIASFNESTLTFNAVAAPAAPKNDGNDEENWTILPNGQILTIDAGLANSYEIYDPVANTWNQPSPNTTAGVTLSDLGSNCNSTELGPAVSRPDGTIIQFSGNQAGQNAVYTIATGTWAVGPTFANSDTVADGPASLLVNGHVLVMASPGCTQTSPGPPPKYSTFNSPSHFYEFDGTNLNDVTPSSPGTNGPNAPGLISFFGRMLLLPSGRVLVTHRGDSTTDVWTYTPSGGPLDAWRPGITTSPSVIGQGQTYSISGTMFNGFSQGASYGDDAQMATNWPLVRITNTGSGHVFYARTHDHSRMGVEAVGDTEIVSTNFDVPASLELGASTLVVVTNGIPSTPVNVTVEQGSSLAFTGASATSSDFNDAVTVQAQLTSGGSPVSTPETVTFVLGSGIGTETCSGTTNSSGVASCSITPNQAAGGYTLTATFGGDSTYAGSSTSTAFTILHEETAIAFTGASATNADFDDAATVQAQLTTDGVPLASESVTISLGAGGGTETCAVPMTDGGGLATCSITPNQQAGTYTITATFAGDAFYAPSSATASFIINKEETTTKFTLSSPTVIANGHIATFSAVLLEDGVTPIQGRTITITIGTQSCPAGPTDPTGTASCSILISQVLGPGTVTASFAGDPFYLPSSATEPVIVFAFLNSGSMVIGNLDGNPVEFWGAQWAKSNSLSGGSAPNSFKGFASTAPQTCGGGWSSNPGNSSGPPAGPLPSYMGVVVSSAVVQSGSLISGDVPKIVVVKTYPGYGPDPGHAGTGTVVAVFCGH